MEKLLKALLEKEHLDYQYLLGSVSTYRLKRHFHDIEYLALLVNQHVYTHAIRSLAGL